MKLRMSVLALFCALAALPAGVAPRASAQSTGTARLLVKFTSASTPSSRAYALAKAGARSLGRVRALGVRVIAVPADDRVAAEGELRASGAVAYVERDATVTALGTTVTPTDPLYAGNSWPDTQTQLPAAWAAGTGSGVTVAVVDTGVSPVGDIATSGTVLPGYNAITGTTDTADDNGHGTAVSSVIAGGGDNGVGSAGVCWGCRILPVKVLGSDGSGSTGTVAAGVTWAADHGAQIINMSLGGPQSDQTLASAVAYAESKGVIVVAAAGNAGTSAPVYPADYSGVVSVAASTATDTRESFSSYGSWVQVAAPGCMVAQNRDSTFGTWCGTSFSSPMVAGIAALALSDKPSTTAAQFASALYAKADKVPGSYVSHGRANAAATLAALGVSVPALALANREAPAIAASSPVVGTAVSGNTGAWQLPPGATASYSYQWLRCTSACSTISGATRSSYTVATADRGDELELTVTAKAAGLVASATSQPTAAVGMPALPVASLPPTISATSVLVGEVLRAVAGTWTGQSSVTRQWLRCNADGNDCAAIPGATTSAYTLAKADSGDTIRLRETATNIAGSTASQSDATTVVALPPAPTDTVAPSVTGSSVVGKTLTAKTGTWTAVGSVTVARQWLRCSADGGDCASIAGKTASTYVLAAADAGSTIRLQVTATGLGGATVVRTDATETIDPAPAPAATAPPTVKGTAKVGQTLTGAKGTWTDANAYTYRWLRCSSTSGDSCVAIAKATSSTYKIGSADAGSRLVFEVSATGLGGTTVRTADGVTVAS